MNKSSYLKFFSFVVIIIIGLILGFFVNQSRVTTKNRASGGRELECSFPLTTNRNPNDKIRIDAIEIETDQTQNQKEKVLASTPDGFTVNGLEKISANGVDFGKYTFSSLSTITGVLKCRLTIVETGILDAIASKTILNCPVTIESTDPIICPLDTPLPTNPNSSPSPTPLLTNPPTSPTKVPPTPTPKNSCGQSCDTIFDCDQDLGVISCTYNGNMGTCTCVQTPTPTPLASKSPTPTTIPSPTFTPSPTKSPTPTPTKFPQCFESCDPNGAPCSFGMKCVNITSSTFRCVSNDKCQSPTSGVSCWCFPSTPTPSPTPTKTMTTTPTPTKTPTPTPFIPRCIAPTAVSSVAINCKIGNCTWKTTNNSTHYLVRVINTSTKKPIAGFEQPMRISPEILKSKGAVISFKVQDGINYQCEVASENSCSSTAFASSDTCGNALPTSIPSLTRAPIPTQKITTIISTPAIITVAPKVIVIPGGQKIVQKNPEVIQIPGEKTIIKSPSQILVTGTSNLPVENIPTSEPIESLPEAGLPENAIYLFLLGASVLVFGLLL